MMTRSQLQYKYEWSDINDSDFDPIPSPTNVLQRNDGFQVLRFINHCAHVWGMTPEDKLGHKEIEIILQDFVPDELSTQEEIMDWIEANYTWYLVSKTKKETEIILAVQQRS